MQARRGRSSARAGCPRPAHVRELGLDAGLPGGLPRRRRRRRDQAERQARPRPARVRRRDPVSAARFTASGTPAAPVLAQPRALPAATRCARCSPTPAARTPPPAGAGSTTPPRRRGPRRVADGRRSGRGRARLDRRRSATHLPVDAVLKGILEAARSSCAATATRTSSRRSRRPTRSRSAPASRSSCRRAPCA